MMSTTLTMKEQVVIMIMIHHKQVVVETIITITITITITMIIMITSRWLWKLFHCDLLTTRGIDLPSWSQETRSR